MSRLSWSTPRLERSVSGLCQHLPNMLIFMSLLFRTASLSNFAVVVVADSATQPLISMAARSRRWEELFLLESFDFELRPKTGSKLWNQSWLTCPLPVWQVLNTFNCGSQRTDGGDDSVEAVGFAKVGCVSPLWSDHHLIQKCSKEIHIGRNQALVGGGGESLV